MPSRTKLTFAGVSFCLIASLPAATFSYNVAGEDAGPWPRILSSIGFSTAAGGPANLFIVRSVAAGSVPQWLQRIDQGALVVIEGDSDLADALGFRAGKKHVVVRSIVDQCAPRLPIVWEKPVELPVFEIPKQAKVFTRERWEGAPLVAAIRRGSGAALWIATSPGEQGYER